MMILSLIEKQSVKARYASEFEDYGSRPQASGKTVPLKIYRCKMCRWDQFDLNQSVKISNRFNFRVDLFNSQSVVKHNVRENVEVCWKVAAKEGKEPDRPCSEGLFIVPVKWMEKSVEEPHGKVLNILILIRTNKFNGLIELRFLARSVSAN